MASIYTEEMFIKAFIGIKESILDEDMEDSDRLIDFTKQFVKSKNAFFIAYRKSHHNDGMIFLRFIINTPFKFFKFIFEYYNITENDLYRNLDWKDDEDMRYSCINMFSSVEIFYDDSKYGCDLRSYRQSIPIDITKDNYMRLIFEETARFSSEKIEYLDKRFNYRKK